MLLAQLVEQVVGLHRLAGCCHKLQHFPAQRRQAQAALLAGMLDRAHETLRIMMMVRMMRVLVVGAVVAQCFHLEIDHTSALQFLSAATAAALIAVITAA